MPVGGTRRIATTHAHEKRTHTQHRTHPGGSVNTRVYGSVCSVGFSGVDPKTAKWIMEFNDDIKELQSMIRKYSVPSAIETKALVNRYGNEDYKFNEGDLSYEKISKIQKSLCDENFEGVGLSCEKNICPQNQNYENFEGVESSCEKDIAKNQERLYENCENFEGVGLSCEKNICPQNQNYENFEGVESSCEKDIAKNQERLYENYENFEKVGLSCEKNVAKNQERLYENYENFEKVGLSSEKIYKNDENFERDESSCQKILVKSQERLYENEKHNDKNRNDEEKCKCSENYPQKINRRFCKGNENRSSILESSEVRKGVTSNHLNKYRDNIDKEQYLGGDSPIRSTRTKNEIDKVKQALSMQSSLYDSGFEESLETIQGNTGGLMTSYGHELSSMEQLGACATMDNFYDNPRTIENLFGPSSGHERLVPGNINSLKLSNGHEQLEACGTMENLSYDHPRAIENLLGPSSGHERIVPGNTESLLSSNGHESLYVPSTGHDRVMATPGSDEYCSMQSIASRDSGIYATDDINGDDREIEGLESVNPELSIPCLKIRHDGNRNVNMDDTNEPRSLLEELDSVCASPDPSCLTKTPSYDTIKDRMAALSGRPPDWYFKFSIGDSQIPIMGSIGDSQMPLMGSLYKSLNESLGNISTITVTSSVSGVGNDETNFSGKTSPKQTDFVCINPRGTKNIRKDSPLSNGAKTSQNQNETENNNVVDVKELAQDFSKIKEKLRSLRSDLEDLSCEASESKQDFRWLECRASQLINSAAASRVRLSQLYAMRILEERLQEEWWALYNDNTIPLHENYIV